MNAQQAPAFNVAPFIKMYLDSVEVWKHSYDALAEDLEETAQKHETPARNVAKPPVELAAASWQKPAGDIYQHFIHQQLAVWRLATKRWQSYLDLPAQLARCETPAAIGQLQADFMKRLVDDDIQEAASFSQDAARTMPSGKAFLPV